jgi:hypothetical protein
MLTLGCENSQTENNTIHIYSKKIFGIVTIEDNKVVTSITEKLKEIEFADENYNLVSDGGPDYKIWLDNKAKDERIMNLYFWQQDNKVIVFDPYRGKYGLINKQVFDSIIECEK